MPTLTGRCFCDEVQYELKLNDIDDARTSLCHCKSCKRFFGGAFGMTTKVPKDAITFLEGEPKTHVSVHTGGARSGSGEGELTRRFCGTCGTPILEFAERAKDSFRYIVTGTLDEHERLPPKGEFFCSERESWMPEIPNVFHKEKVNR